MAGFSYKTLPDEPILVLTFHQTYDVRTDLQAAIEQGIALLAEADRPVYYINDMTDAPPFTLGDLTSVASTISRTGNAILHHPNMGEYIVVSRSAAMKLATKGLSNPAFGSVPTNTFDTLDEALAYARSQTA